MKYIASGPNRMVPLVCIFSAAHIAGNKISMAIIFFIHLTPCTSATGTQCRLSELRSSLVLHLVRWTVTQHGCHYPTKPTGRADQKMLRIALNLNSQHTTNGSDELHLKTLKRKAATNDRQTLLSNNCKPTCCTQRIQTAHWFTA